ncbi:hypothetical protein BGZ83_010353 [Gryganskiella cystojenkinii]|nr:hypothetical protein BGZ83_010353 [Gryganskiella cystojenkinii]
MASSSDLAALSSISTQKEPAASPVGLTARSGSSLSSLVSQPEKSREMSGLAHNSSLGSNGGGGLGGLGGGRLQRQSDLGTKSGSSGSSSLSGLASRSLQSRASPSLAGLAGLAKKTEPSSLAPIYTQDRSEDIEVSRPSIAEQHSSSSQTVLYDDDTVAYGQESNESTFTMADQFAAASPFSSLIAKPSHFAISIFERLDPTPLPIAVKTAANIAAFNSSSSSIPSSILSTSATTTTIKSVPTPAVKAALLAETEALVLSKAFQFDQPSPDDIVFKAQGTRAPATGAPGSNK